MAHACVAFGHLPVDAIRASDMRTWQLRMARLYAPATVNGHMQVLRLLFDYPLADGLIPVNPARYVRALPVGRTRGKRGNALSLKEFRCFLQAIPAQVAQGNISDVHGRMLLTLAWTVTHQRSPGDLLQRA